MAAAPVWLKPASTVVKNRKFCTSLESCVGCCWLRAISVPFSIGLTLSSPLKFHRLITYFENLMYLKFYNSQVEMQTGFGWIKKKKKQKLKLPNKLVSRATKFPLNAEKNKREKLNKPKKSCRFSVSREIVHQATNGNQLFNKISDSLLFLMK